MSCWSGAKDINTHCLPGPELGPDPGPDPGPETDRGGELFDKAYLTKYHAALKSLRE